MKLNETEMYSKGELSARAETALMGRAVMLQDRDNLIYVIDYICKVLKCTSVTGEQILELAEKHLEEKTKPIGLVCNTIGGEMECLTVILKDFDGSHFQIDDESGVLCYVYNFTVPDFSELGYCYFKKSPSGVRRIG